MTVCHFLRTRVGKEQIINKGFYQVGEKTVQAANTSLLQNDQKGKTGEKKSYKKTLH